MFISVVIPAKNEERFIARTLAALNEQSFDRSSFEVIVADNGSTDKTVELAKDAGAKVFIYPEQSLGALRNRAAAEGRGDVYAFLDADCVPNPHWLSHAAQVFSQERCVTGTECDVADDAGWVTRAWFCLQPKTRMRVESLGSGNMLIDRETFLMLSGFDEKLKTGEDTELCLRALRLVPVIADPGFRAVHLGTPRTLQQFFQREVWHGLGAFGTFNHRRFDKPLIGTAFFGGSLVVVAFGLFGVFGSNSASIAAAAAVAIVILLSASVLFRRQYVRSPLHALQLFILFFVYYLGRSFALILNLLPTGVGDRRSR